MGLLDRIPSLVRIEDIALEVRVGGFAVEGEFAEPETEGLVVDEEDDLQGDEGEFGSEPKEAGGGEGLALSSEGAEEDVRAIGTGAVVDVDFEMLSRQPEFEVEIEVQGAEGRDVKVLGGDEAVEGNRLRGEV